MRGAWAVGVVVALQHVAGAAAGYNYIPLPMMKYDERDPVGPIGVNSLFSHEDVVHDDFYSLKFCSPDKETIEKHSRVEKIGEVLMGDRIQPSLYEAHMLVNKACVPVSCKPEERQVNERDLRQFERRVEHGYRGTFVLDNLPVVDTSMWVHDGHCPSGARIPDHHARGWPLGVPKACTGEDVWINNHLELKIHYNEVVDGESKAYVIVGFNVEPHSVAHASVDSCNEHFRINEDHPKVRANPQKTKEIIWSYAVTWVKSDVEWQNRWDAYLNLAFSNRNDKVHWMGIVNSSLMILVLATIVAIILIRALRMDISRYEEQAEELKEVAEEGGWKLIHGDVFRPPPHPRLFATMLGTGAQLLGMAALVFVFALLGFLSPANRGGLITAAILLFVLMALVNGFMSALLLKSYGIEEWRPIFGSALFFPGILFFAWLFSEILIITTRPTYNSTPIALNTLKIFALWLCVSVPLVLLGASFAKKSGPSMAPPLKVNAAPRRILSRQWYLETWFLMFMPGLVPFGAAFLELRFILSSMWQGQVYYMFGFLTITAVTVVIVSMELTVVLLYFLLVHEDHRWWWSSFIIPGGMGIHFFLYSLYYAATSIRIKTLLSMYIFTVIMALFSTAMYIAVGAIGIVSGYAFVRVIYSSIHID